jgi:hypothetical protein
LRQKVAKQPAPYGDGSDISSALLAWNSTDPLPARVSLGARKQIRFQIAAHAGCAFRAARRP